MQKRKTYTKEFKLDAVRRNVQSLANLRIYAAYLRANRWMAGCIDRATHVPP